MKTSTFKTTQRGLMGSDPLGGEYIPDVNDRVRRMKAALGKQDQLTTAFLNPKFNNRVEFTWPWAGFLT